MASSLSNDTYAAGSSAEESSVVQVLDSNEPLGASSSGFRVQVNSSKPLVPRISEPSTCSMSLGLSHSRRTKYTSQEISSHWSLEKVYARLGTEEACIQFAEECGLIPTEKMCSYHKRPMALRTSGIGQLGTYRCTKSNCRLKTVSRGKGTWFEDARLAINIIFQVMYLYCIEFTYEGVQKEIGGKCAVLSTRTIAYWFSYCRETIVIFMIENANAVQNQIGGPGQIVQIYKSKFGKRKHNRGRHIEGHWVLGMIENGSDDLRLEMCPDNDKSVEILVPLIKKHVQEGSEIHTDFWQAYDCLSEHGYIHKKINYNDPEHGYGAHTQREESHWHDLKFKFKSSSNTTNFADWLVVYKWRQNVKINHADLFEELIKVIKYVYSVKTS